MKPQGYTVCLKNYLQIIFTLCSLKPHHLHQPFKPQHQHACSPHCYSYIWCGTNWENLHKHQDITSLVIMIFILMSCMFDQVVIL